MLEQVVGADGQPCGLPDLRVVKGRDQVVQDEELVEPQVDLDVGDSVTQSSRQRLGLLHGRRWPAARPDVDPAGLERGDAGSLVTDNQVFDRVHVGVLVPHRVLAEVVWVLDPVPALRAVVRGHDEGARAHEPVHLAPAGLGGGVGDGLAWGDGGAEGGCHVGQEGPVRRVDRELHRVVVDGRHVGQEVPEGDDDAAGDLPVGVHDSLEGGHDVVSGHVLAAGQLRVCGRVVELDAFLQLEGPRRPRIIHFPGLGQAGDVDNTPLRAEGPLVVNEPVIARLEGAAADEPRWSKCPGSTPRTM